MLIAFDLEGTLLDGEFFPEIGKALGKKRAFLSITNQCMDGYLGFEESLYRRFEMIRGSTIAEIEEVCRGIHLVEGARETVESLRKPAPSWPLSAGASVCWRTGLPGNSR